MSTLKVDAIQDSGGNYTKQQVVQVVNVKDGEVATGTTQIAADDTIPQNTEGDEYMTLSITPKSTSNILLIEASINGYHTNAGEFKVCLLKVIDEVVPAVI